MKFAHLIKSLGDENERRFALAELNDLLTGLKPAELTQVVSTPPRLEGLSLYLQNYVAAMVEQASHQKAVPAPAWLNTIRPLQEPHFAANLAGLRLYLLATAPVPFRRRNIFVDSGIGDRV